MIPNYENKLIEWATGKLGLPYVWGVTDCGTLVREGLSLILGRDAFDGIPRWGNEQECRAVWEFLGGVDKAFVDFGAEKINIFSIQTGDVAVLEIDKDITSILVLGDYKMLFSSIEKGVNCKNLSMNSLSKLDIRFYRFK